MAATLPFCNSSRRRADRIGCRRDDHDLARSRMPHPRHAVNYPFTRSDRPPFHQQQHSTPNMHIISSLSIVLSLMALVSAGGYLQTCRDCHIYKINVTHRDCDLVTGTHSQFTFSVDVVQHDVRTVRGSSSRLFFDKKVSSDCLHEKEGATPAKKHPRGWLQCPTTFSSSITTKTTFQPAATAYIAQSTDKHEPPKFLQLPTFYIPQLSFQRCRYRHDALSRAAYIDCAR